MFGSLDKTFCMNRDCPRSGRCGRSVKRLDGGRFIVSMSSFSPEPDGTCKHEEEYQEYVPTKRMRALAKDYNVERALQQERKEANSLDPKTL
jgi:hypothetical protein